MEYLKYDEALSYSYVFGAFGTIELLNNKLNMVLAILIDPSFVNNEAFNKIKDICLVNNIPLIIDLKIIDKIRDKKNIFVIGVFKKYTSTLKTNKHLLLNNVNDVGCIGTIIRSMRGFDVSDLVLINCNVDIFNYHLIRSTMGAFFQCNIMCFNSLADYLNMFKNQHIYQIANKGNNATSYKNDNFSLLFNYDKELDYEKIVFDKDLSLDNIVNIVLYSFYKK